MPICGRLYSQMPKEVLQNADHTCFKPLVDDQNSTYSGKKTERRDYLELCDQIAEQFETVMEIYEHELRNVPDEGIYVWDPGAHLGVHRIDEFFFAPEPKQ